MDHPTCELAATPSHFWESPKEQGCPNRIPKYEGGVASWLQSTFSVQLVASSPIHATFVVSTTWDVDIPNSSHSSGRREYHNFLDRSKHHRERHLQCHQCSSQSASQATREPPRDNHSIASSHKASSEVVPLSSLEGVRTLPKTWESVGASRT